MRVISLGSGSTGNALLIEAGPQRRTRLLIDAGLSLHTITTRLLSVGVSPAQLQAILVTHEHSDHVQGISALTKRFGLSIVTEPRTYAAIEEGLASGIWHSDSGKLVSAQAEPPIDINYRANNRGDSDAAISLAHEDEHAKQESSVTTGPHPQGALPPVMPLPLGSRRMIGDIEVQSFPASHDAVAPAGYLLSAGGCRMCIVTDSGEVTPEMLTYIRHADLLILESNYDRQRLLRGPYPQVLKQRIISPTGHLSNDQAAEAVLKTWRPEGVRWLWLAHLSRTNNTPTIALQTMRTRLQEAGVNAAYIHISALPPAMGHIWDSTQLWHAPSLWTMIPNQSGN
ncbi:MAG: MBL fold metallo-hydrolase [Ktedonobacteraceae bacterium]|nr:MBL fold metallo-hydrolase [Ktedonobacteraceae bacterium]